MVFRTLFALLFSWGTFIVLVLWLPLAASVAAAIAVGLLWFFFTRIWLHNLVMLLAVVALGAVFGRFISPWTAMILLLVLALYDYLAVRFGYMLWMVKRLSGSAVLPAFIIPYHPAEWNASTNQPAVTGIVETKREDRVHSILGGGDVGFPALLVSSVYFAAGLPQAIIVAVFSLLGLIGAYWSQSALFKERPVPALPPIALVSLIGLAAVSTFLR